VVLIPGTHIDPEKDEVILDGNPVRPSGEKVYLMLNKPPGYLTTAKRENGRPIVLDLIGDIGVRIYPVGRLDFDTEGLLLLTNDGDFAYKLTHPKFKVEKVYLAWVSGVPDEGKLRKLRNGVQTKYFKASPAEVDLLRVKDGNALLRIAIREGRKRQIKHMCAAIGHKVIRLKRVQVGPLKLGTLAKGRYRFLGEEEVKAILDSIKSEEGS
jgi:pseudouridine synthase